MWLIVIVVIGLLIYFVASFNKESGYIEAKPFDQRFKIFIEGINQELMMSSGVLTKVSNREYWFTNHQIKFQFIHRKSTLYIIKHQDFQFAHKQYDKYTFSRIDLLSDENSVEKQKEMVKLYVKHYWHSIF